MRATGIVVEINFIYQYGFVRFDIRPIDTRSTLHEALYDHRVCGDDGRRLSWTPRTRSSGNCAVHNHKCPLEGKRVDKVVPRMIVTSV